MKTLIKISILMLLLTFFTANQIYAAVSAPTSSEMPVKPLKQISKKEFKTAEKQYKSQIRGMKVQEKKEFLKMKIEQDNKKLSRLPLLLTGIGFIVVGALLIFIAFNTIGYLGFIAAVIGIIALIVWLIFKEADKEL